MHTTRKFIALSLSLLLLCGSYQATVAHNHMPSWGGFAHAEEVNNAQITPGEVVEETQPPMLNTPLPTNAAAVLPELTPPPYQSLESGNGVQGQTEATAPEPPMLESPTTGEDGEMSVGVYKTPKAVPGGALTLAVPIRYDVSDVAYQSNVDVEANIRPYRADAPVTVFAQALTALFEEVSISIALNQPDQHPLAESALRVRAVLLSEGINRGYAVLEQVLVAEDAIPGVYPLNLLIHWKDKEGGETHTQAIVVSVEVLDPSGEEMESSVPEPPPDGEAESPAPELPPDGEAEPPAPELPPDGEAESPAPELPADGEAESPAPELPADGEAESPADMQEELRPENCACCERCPLCFTAEGLPAAKSCVCFDKNGTYLGCSCVWLSEDDVLCADAACTCGCLPLNADAADASAEGYLLADDGGEIVFTFLELKDAIERGTASTIYLGYGETNENGETKNDGLIRYTQSGGITANRSITIVGTDPRSGKRVTLEDYTTSTAANTLHTGTAGITVHLRDMDVIGHNFYGIVHVPSGGSSVAFTNVSYTGRQIVCAYGAGTSVSFTDCTVNIQNMDGNSGEEVVEAAEVRLYGNNTITRSATFSGATWSMFWLNASPYKVTVQGNASLQTNNYFIYDPTNSAQLNVQGALNISTAGNNGGMTNAALYLRECTVSSGGALNISHTGSTYASLRVRNLNVSGTLTIDKVNNSLPCIELNTGGSAIFQSPEYVRLTNPSGRLLYSTLGTVSVQIVTQALNRWQGSGEPFVWNNRDLAGYTTAFSINTTGVASDFSTTLSGGKGAAYGASQLTAANLDFYRSPKITFGQHALTVDDVYVGERKVSGTASGGTQTAFEYAYSGETPGSLRQSVAAGGNYRADFAAPIQKDSCIYVKSVIGDLEAHTYTFPLTSCFFYEVPDMLDFGTIPISASARVVNRLDPDWTIAVKDTRDAGDLWSVYASAEPLRATDGAVLDGALVFVSGMSMYSLQAADVRIATQLPGAWETTTDIRFPQGEGLALSVNAFAGEPGALYQATITWTLRLGP